MAFRGLEDRFNSRVTSLYEGTARDSGLKAPSNEPFLEFAPNNPNARETQDDSRTLPIGSIKRDISRISRFLVSGPGLRFLAKQAVLQSGNAFGETRIYNPLFVIGNVQPYKHIGRNLANPSDFPMQGEYLSPASSPTIGRAGRLQKNTADMALSRALGTNGSKGLLSLIAPRSIVSAITKTFSVASGGSTGQNERPEFRVNDTLYSVAVWQGFKKQQTPASALNSAKANLRTGNVIGAFNNIKNALTTFLKGSRPSGITQLSAPQGRNDPLNYDMFGRRYFITDNKIGADRYLPNSIVWDASNRPDTSLAYLDRRVRAITGTSVLPPSFAPMQDTTGALKTTARIPIAAPPRSLRGALTNAINKIKAEVKRVERRVESSIRKASADASTLAPRSEPIPPVVVTAVQNDNAAEDRMLFPELSLRQQYLNTDAIKSVKDILDAQQERAFNYWDQTRIDRGFGGTDALRPNDTRIPNGYAHKVNPSYLKDRYNTTSIIRQGNGTEVSDTTIKSIRDKMGTDLVNVFFFDFVNKHTIPLRAYVTGITESVMPEVSDTRYIGRIDRNVVYVGVNREVSFQLKIHAFSSEELLVVWRKINYMTGLCYPSRYDTYGFMIPPFVKLTLGDVWRDQPGYIKSLSHTFEDNTSWEITDDNQAPHGVTINITFAILEKNQVDSGAMFYPVGTTRATARSSTSVGQLPETVKRSMGTTETRTKPVVNPTQPAKNTGGVGGAGRSGVKTVSGGSRVVPDFTAQRDNTRVTPTVPKQSTFGFGRGGGFSGAGGGNDFP